MTCQCLTLPTGITRNAPKSEQRGAAKPKPKAAIPADHRDAAVVFALLDGDEAMFDMLVTKYHRSFVRIAMSFVGTRDVAEEVAQETWLAVVRGLHRFQGRSSLKNWMFRILTNRAKTRGAREGRMMPFTTWRGDDEGDVESIDLDVFDTDGRWVVKPSDWGSISPESHLLGAETHGLVLDAIRELPDKQRIVITMRDIEGFSSREVRKLLELSETYQRVLLHRARVKVRDAISDHVAA